jgi:ribosomal-protein-alanine N-acetyltransferase
MPPPTLFTARLRLRPFSIEDADALFQLQDDAEVMRYFPNPQPPSREKILKNVKEQITHWEQYGYGQWIVELEASRQVMGWAGLQYLPETDESEVGYLLGKAFWGQGYASEAAAASLRYGFSATPLETLIGIVHPGNTASQKVLLHAGMALVGQDHYFGMECFKYRIERRVYTPQDTPYRVEEA